MLFQWFLIHHNQNQLGKAKFLHVFAWFGYVFWNPGLGFGIDIWGYKLKGLWFRVWKIR